MSYMHCYDGFFVPAARESIRSLVDFPSGQGRCRPADAQMGVLSSNDGSDFKDATEFLRCLPGDDG